MTMPVNAEFEMRLHRLDDLIECIKALPPVVTCFRVSADKVYALLAEAGKRESYLAAEISEAGRRLTISKDIAYFDRSAPGYGKIMPFARMPA
jgi:hypothetical protein